LTDGRFELACAASGGQAHPVFGLWPLTLRDALRRALVEEGVRKVDVYTARYKLATVDFPIGEIDPFFNTNSPDDLETAEGLLRVLGPGA
jgi:molybdopterin-guanine dinucleotide biosynthesis protein A